jgi:AraC-like DNA-binding protein/CheY-like chemotaxis protein
MGVETPAVVIFADKNLHSFYKAFATAMGATEVLSSQDAPSWIPHGKADLVIIDCGFRIRQGLRFLKELKKANPRTIVVLIAEKSSENNVIEAFQSGARFYLRSPVGISALRNISRKLLKLRKETREERSSFVEDKKPLPMPSPDISSGKPANVLHAIQFIEENLGGPLDLETCAKQANLSKFHFCRAFKRHFGLSPMKFVNSLRLSRAQDLLCRDDLNITDVAMNVGFNDLGSFIKAFKRYMGVPPRKFRRSSRAKTSA